jgi:hypothetical protein
MSGSILAAAVDAPMAVMFAILLHWRRATEQRRSVTL